MTDKHKLIAAIDAELTSAVVAEPVDVGGHKYYLKLLDRSEIGETKVLIDDSATLLQIVSDNVVPVLSVALRAIDGVDASELFPPSAEAESDKAKRRSVHLQVRDWLNTKPETFVSTLWSKYSELRARSSEALESMGPLSKKTPGSESEPTLLHAKGSALTTLVSEA